MAALGLSFVIGGSPGRRYLQLVVVPASFTTILATIVGGLVGVLAPRLAWLGPRSRGGTSGHCHRPSDSCRTRCVMRSRAREHLQGGERRYPDWAAAIGHNAEARSARTATSGRTSASSAPSAGHEPPSVRGPIVRTSSALRGQHQSLEHYGQVVSDHSAAELSKERPSLDQALCASSGSDEPGRP